MKLKLFEPLVLKFERADWARNPEFALFDTILEQHPELIKIVENDITVGSDESNFGRGDSPSVEQIMRGALYKELKHLNYRELEYAQSDSRICEQFVKINLAQPYSFQVYQKYISKISAESLETLMVSLNKIAIEEGLEDIHQFRQDSTVVETNIHYPTNNSLVWDCIKEGHRLLRHLKEEIDTFDFTNYAIEGKKTYFKINVTKCEDKRTELFRKQLVLFIKCIEAVSNVVKKRGEYSISLAAIGILAGLERVLPLMKQVFSMTHMKEIRKQKVVNEKKLFSIYELHTDIIVKGQREVQFGHKINLGTGKSNLILSCEVAEGNPKDTSLYQDTLTKIKNDYEVIPLACVTDGGYASLTNRNFAQEMGIKNIVFNKIVGSVRNITENEAIEICLKKWRSGIEAVISNLKRGFKLFRCNWKGWNHFKQKIYWSVIAYNIRVMTASMLELITV